MADVDIALPAVQRESYTPIIDSILAASDLNTISAKRIRKGLQEQVAHDLAPQKAAITALIMERFDKVQTAAKASTVASKRKSPALEDSPAPKKKAKKNMPKAEETDEQIAARLQAVYDTQVNARATRGGGKTKKAPLKKSSVVKKKKKKSSAKVTGEDDSDLEGGSGADKPEKERKGGFHKPMNLSPALSEMLGETQLSRPQTVKKIWEYVKARDLQNPKDKRQIFCDEAMRKVFKGDSVHMFTMNKLLVQHLKPADEVVGGEIVQEKVEESEDEGDVKTYVNGGGEEPVRESETEGESEA